MPIMCLAIDNHELKVGAFDPVTPAMNPDLTCTSFAPAGQQLRLLAAHLSHLILEIIANQEFPFSFLLCRLLHIVGTQRLICGGGATHPRRTPFPARAIHQAPNPARNVS